MTYWQRIRRWWRLRKHRRGLTVVVTPYVVESAPLRPGWKAETKPTIRSWDRSTWPTEAECKEMAERRERAKAYLKAKGVPERPGCWPWGDDGKENLG